MSKTYALDNLTKKLLKEPKKMNHKAIYEQRNQFFKLIRLFFEKKDFLEVHTPLLVPNPGLDLHILPFESKYEWVMGEKPQTETLYLATSPEYHLKIALAHGLDKIFEITHSFRNGERSHQHTPEFFMLEWYRHPGNYHDIANDLEELIQFIAPQLSKDKKWLNKPEHMSVNEAFKKHAQVDLLKKQKELDPLSFENFYEITFLEKVEKKLGQNAPCFLWDFPISLASLANIDPDKKVSKRFELYWQGTELANAFDELCDKQKLLKKCQKDQKLRLNKYKKSPPLDTEFIEAHKNLSQAGGIALGLDRWLQCLLEKPNIRDIWPLCRL